MLEFKRSPYSEDDALLILRVTPTNRTRLGLIHKAAQAVDPTIGLARVKRALQLAVERGWIIVETGARMSKHSGADIQNGWRRVVWRCSCGCINPLLREWCKGCSGMRPEEGADVR
jgi:hypothetical protein